MTEQIVVCIFLSEEIQGALFIFIIYVVRLCLFLGLRLIESGKGVSHFKEINYLDYFFG